MPDRFLDSPEEGLKCAETVPQAGQSGMWTLDSIVVSGGWCHSLRPPDVSLGFSANDLNDAIRVCLHRKGPPFIE